MKLLALASMAILVNAAGLAWGGPSVEESARELSGQALEPLVEETGVRHLTAWTGEWASPGVSAQTGDLVSVMAEGSWDGAPGLAPSVWLRVRVSASGPAFNLRSDAQSFVADSTGEVEVLVRGGFRELIRSAPVASSGNVVDCICCWLPFDLAFRTEPPMLGGSCCSWTRR